jgi:2-keto-3-deoxy-L-rhamnonate aldolase RhmA
MIFSTGADRPSPSLKDRITSGELTFGSWLSSSDPAVCEIMAKAGFDWLVIDMEHTAIDTSHAQQLIQIIDLAGCVPMVRIGCNDRLLIKRAMDAGAYGIVVPMVNTPAEAHEAVLAVRYPPAGTRGVGLSRAQGYGLGFEDYKAWAERETILIVQIEHIDAVRNLESILAVEGVDGFIVGPYDLSGSIGRPGEFDDPDVVGALSVVAEVMNRSSKVGGFHVVHSNQSELVDKIRQGYKFLAYGNDMVFLAEKIAAESSFVRQQMGGAPGGNP